MLSDFIIMAIVGIVAGAFVAVARINAGLPATDLQGLFLVNMFAQVLMIIVFIIRGS